MRIFDTAGTDRAVILVSNDGDLDLILQALAAKAAEGPFESPFNQLYMRLNARVELGRPL